MTTAIDAIADASDAATASAAFQACKGEAGFAEAYFARVQTAFASDVSHAAKLSSHWRLLLRYGDNPAFAYRTKGVSDRLASRWLNSAKAFIKSGALATNDVDRLSFQVGAVDSLARAGRIAEAISLGRDLSQGLERLGEDGLAGRVRLNVGNALLWADRYRDAQSWLREAITALERAGSETEAIFAKVGLSTAELYGGSPRESHRLAEEARIASVESGLDHVAILCELNIAQAALMQGHADEALQTLLRARPLLESSPHDSARISQFLGDAYLKLNLWPEAVSAYEEALSQRSALGPLDIGATMLGLGQTHLAGDAEGLAIVPLRKSIALFRRLQNRPWTAAAETLLAKAIHRQGRSGRAHDLASKAVSQARASRSAWHEAEALLTAAECRLAIDKEVLPYLNRAAKLIEGNGYRSLRWRIPALKSNLAAPRSRLRAHRQTFEAILENRLLTSSPISRATYLRDKSAYISAYMAELLSDPSPNRILEAIDVVARSRSAALLDEMLASSSGALRPDQLRQLDELRVELQSLESEAQQPNGVRRAAVPHARISALQRKWIEATHLLVNGSSARSDIGRSSAVVLARASESLFALRGSTATKLRIDASELERRLRWIRFELLSPMADRKADPRPALELIEDLACGLVAPWLENQATSVAICPEDQLWNVPWTTCFSALSTDREPILALHPNLTNATQFRCSAASRAMIWIDRSENLYHAGEEELLFLESFPGAIVCRSAAEARESLKEEVDFLHVICHARHNAANPMFSALQFSDGALYAAEIARSDLRAQVVSLSACETGSVSVAIRDEPDGLARAFLARGAETVIGSLWPLDDEAAAKLYATLFNQLLRGVLIIDALRVARRAVKDWNPHPYFWGSLALFGGYVK